MCQELNNDVMPWKQCKGYPSASLEPRELLVQSICNLTRRGLCLLVEPAGLENHWWRLLWYCFIFEPPSYQVVFAPGKIASVFLKSSLIWTLLFLSQGFDLSSSPSKQYLLFKGHSGFSLFVKSSLIASDHNQIYLEYCAFLIYCEKCVHL